MKALKIIAIAIAVLVAIIVILGLVAPKSFDIHREIVINSSEENVWRGISTFEAFDKWNPWNKLDSNQVIKEEGIGGKVGDKHSWKGNKKVGEGSMTVTSVEPNKTLEYHLVFGSWDMQNTGYFNMDKAGEGYKITWGMRGRVPFPFNAMALFGNMDKEGGKDFEEGLAGLKSYCESEPVYKIAEANWSGRNCLSIRQVVDFKDFNNFFGTHYPKMYEAISKAGAKPGIPLGVYYKYDEKAHNSDVAAAIPFDGKKVTSKDYPLLNLPESKAYLIDYFGDYTKIKSAYHAMNAKLKTMGRENPDLVIEEYATDPMVEKDTAKWETKIYFFVKNEQAMK